MKPHYRCFTKATNKELGTPQYSVNWALSKRAWLNFYSDRLECGSWKIPFNEIREATLFTGRQSFIPVFVLKIETASQVYQFGMNPWANPTKHLPIPLKQEKIELKYSVASAVIRVLVVGYLVFRIVAYLRSN